MHKIIRFMQIRERKRFYIAACFFYPFFFYEKVSSDIHLHSTQILLNNRNNCVKSPVQLQSELIVKKLCDKKQPNNSVNLPPPPASLRSPRRSTSAALDYQNSVRYFIRSVKLFTPLSS